MANVSRKNISYPIKNFNAFEMGAEYIHSNWLFFENTIQKSFNGEDLLIRAAKKLHRGIINIVKKEIEFYEGVEKQYLDQVSKEEGGLDKEQLKELFWSKYEAQLKNPKTAIGKLESYKIQSSGASRWPTNKNFNMKTEAEMRENMQKQGKSGRGRGRSYEELQKEVGNSIKFLLRVLNDSRFKEKLTNYTIKNPGRFVPDLKVKSIKALDPDFIEAVIERIEEIERKLKNVDSNRAGPEDARYIADLINDLGLNIHLGVMQEKYTPKFINSVLSSFTGKDGARLQSSKFKNSNVIDTDLAVVKYKDVDTLIGLSQKYTKNPSFSVPYVVKNDIYDAVDNFAQLNLKGTAEIKKNAKYMMYIRKNLAALDSWALDSPRGIINYDSFVAKEAVILFLLNFLRFFNGASFMIENGNFAITKQNKEDRFGRIFNVFLLTRHGLYYTTELLNSLLEVIENFEKIIFSENKKNIGFNITGFSSTIIFKSRPSVKSSNLWKAKNKAFKKLKKGKISSSERKNGIKKLNYKNLQEQVLNALKEVGDEAGALTIDKFNYYLHPGQLLRDKKK